MGQISPVFGSIIPSQSQLALQNNYVIKDEILERLAVLKSNKSYTKLIENGLVLCKN